MTGDATILHATTVAVEGRGVMIIGPSGAGKSALAVQLIALGAVLVADDRTHVAMHDEQIIASAPATIAGLIEAREVGLIQVPQAGPTPVHLVIDMGQSETERLPHPHNHTILGRALPCLHKSDNGYFPSAVLLYMRDKQRLLHVR